jgi:glycosyltransferase involved in cell wall biosynthesis
MKILHIINNLGSGGAEKLIEDTLPIMNKKEDIELEVLLLTDKNNVFAESLKKQGIKINVIGTDNIYSPTNIISIRKFIKNNDFDIIHAHLFPTIYWTSLAAKTLLNRKFKLVFTEHSTHNRRRNYIIFKPIDRFIYNEFDKVISISQKTKANLIDWLGAKKKNKFTIIENGIGTQKFNEAEAYSKKEMFSTCTEDNTFITMVGRFSEQKDQKTLIRALKQLDNNVHLFLVGEGLLIEEHKKYVENLNLNNRVHFLGFRSDVERILKTSDIVVLSSYWEGFGLAAVEGMAAGKSVIASDVSGLREVVKDAGLLFEQGDDEELAEIINELINNNDYYDLVSQKCLKKAEKYDISKMLNSLLKVYRDIK